MRLRPLRRARCHSASAFERDLGGIEKHILPRSLCYAGSHMGDRASEAISIPLNAADPGKRSSPMQRVCVYKKRRRLQSKRKTYFLAAPFGRQSTECFEALFVFGKCSYRWALSCLFCALEGCRCFYWSCFTSLFFFVCGLFAKFMHDVRVHYALCHCLWRVMKKGFAPLHSMYTLILLCPFEGQG